MSSSALGHPSLPPRPSPLAAFQLSPGLSQLSRSGQAEQSPRDLVVMAMPRVRGGGVICMHSLAPYRDGVHRGERQAGVLPRATYTQWLSLPWQPSVFLKGPRLRLVKSLKSEAPDRC